MADVYDATVPLGDVPGAVHVNRVNFTAWDQGRYTVQFAEVQGGDVVGITYYIDGRYSMYEPASLAVSDALRSKLKRAGYVVRPVKL